MSPQSQSAPIGSSEHKETDDLAARLGGKRKQFAEEWHKYQDSINRESELTQILNKFKRIEEITREYNRLKEENEHKRIELQDIRIEIESLEREADPELTARHLAFVASHGERNGIRRTG